MVRVQEEQPRLRGRALRHRAVDGRHGAAARRLRIGEQVLDHALRGGERATRFEQIEGGERGERGEDNREAVRGR